MFNERGQVCMNEQHGGLQSRLVADRKRDGRRKYDEDAKRELIQACLKPGVSIARTAMEHDINPNLVRTWISQVSARTSRGRDSQLRGGAVTRGSRRVVDGFRA
ncbi:transposase [Burkholderia glumae]|uniref:transposase n=1 Tax=Burkholderia glumae TaxID=337 RepID=UPI0020D0F04E|nr:transposase [Burkholderia glumae]